MQVIKGATDITTYFVLRDSTNHAPKTDITVTDLDLYYVSYKTAISSKTDATALDSADSAHADNKAFNVGQGVYRIDWPDLWTGDIGTTVQLIVICSGVDTTFLEIEIVDVAQTGDSYAVVSNANYGNSALKTLMDTTGIKIATNSDKTGYSLAATQNEYAPAKAGDVMVVSDKTGFSLSTSGIKAIWDFLIADVTTVIDSFANLFKINIDAKISEAGGGGGLDAAGVRAAIGMSSANLDEQLETILLQISALGTGTGPVEKPYYVSANGGPCGDVLVIMSLDTERQYPIHKGTTDATGWVKFYPNVPSGTKVYMWSFKTGVNFNNPDEETV